MNTNPSVFPGDLSRPVTSVSWFDATNYCAKLTQRELAAVRIPAGSRYRLPTEAEWELHECAANSNQLKARWKSAPGWEVARPARTNRHIRDNSCNSCLAAAPFVFACV